jgi:hypothetical protein
MIGHETVRRNGELFIARGSPNLRHHEIDSRRLAKERLA